ncbi:MAG: response regulator, partial [Succinivibrio sp.]
MIYCLEDDADIRELELYTLGSMNFECEGFYDAKSFFEAVSKKLPDLVVLDVMLPDLSGTDVLKRLR